MNAKPRGRFLIIFGWVLLVFSGIVLVGTLQQPRYRDPSIESLLTRPDGYAVAGTIGVLIGSNIFSILAGLFGLYALMRKNPSAKALIIASVTLFLVNSSLLFLPSSDVVSEGHYSPMTVTVPQSEFTVTFPRPAKKKVVTAAGTESIAYESEGSASSAYLRVEFMQGVLIPSLTNSFRAILQEHATLSGLRLPEITETQDDLGRVGTYSGVKTVGDLTVKVYGKMVLGDSSAINCMIVEQLEVFPSQDTASFLGSIKRR